MEKQPLDAWTVVMGGLLGILAWLAGYAATHLFTYRDVQDTAVHQAHEFLEGEVPTGELVGWAFYNAHFVSVEIRNLPLVGRMSIDLIGADGGLSPVLYGVPLVSLFLAGVVAVAVRGVNDPVIGTATGAAILPGYLLCCLAGVWLFSLSVGDVRGGPQLLPAIVVAGIAYPIVAGGIGGAVGATLVGYTQSDSPG